MKTPLTKPSRRAVLAAALFFAGLLTLAARPVASAGANVALTKDSNGLFFLTLSDNDGLKSFSLVPSGKAPYGGEIGRCPRMFQSQNVLFTDPADFTPVMTASVTDCHDNVEELEIPPPKAGATRSKSLKTAEPQAQPIEPKAAASAGPSAEADASPTQNRAEVQAAKARLRYPIAELGGCGGEAACRAYCEELEHIKACVAYAESRGLMTADEAEQGRRFAEIGGKGPGGCRSRESCAAYCEDMANMETCLNFAEKNRFISEKELKEVRAVAKIKREGGKFPGNCTSKAACETYCHEANHMEECMIFAERAGLIPPEELVIAKKMLPLIREGRTPGGCKRKEVCEDYCQKLGNMRECMAFAEANGLMPPEEMEIAKRVMPLMERGETPGGCRSKAECEAYCQEAGRMEECIAFGERAGFMTKDDAERARKSGGAGPGGCRSREQCETFCGDPTHMEECISFAERTGMIPPGEAERARKSGGAGPGGCRSREECEAFCDDQANTEICVEFSVKSGQMRPDEAGPARMLNCHSREECEALCRQPENAEKCAASGPPKNGHGGPPMGEPQFGPPGGRRNEPPFGVPERGGPSPNGPESENRHDEFKRRPPEDSQKQFRGQIPEEFRKMMPEQHQRQTPEDFKRSFPDQIPEEFKKMMPEQFKAQHPDKMPEDFIRQSPDDRQPRDDSRQQMPSPERFMPEGMEKGRPGEMMRRDEEEKGRRIDEQGHEEMKPSRPDAAVPQFGPMDRPPAEGQHPMP